MHISISPNAFPSLGRKPIGEISQKHIPNTHIKNSTMINRVFRAAAITAPPETTKVFSRTIYHIRTGINVAVVFCLSRIFFFGFSQFLMKCTIRWLPSLIRPIYHGRRWWIMSWSSKKINLVHLNKGKLCLIGRLSQSLFEHDFPFKLPLCDFSFSWKNALIFICVGMIFFCRI